MADEVDTEDWAGGDAHAPLPNADSFGVRLWDGDGFDEKRRLDDATPTGAQVLAAFDLHPVNEFVLLLLDKDGICQIEPDEVIDISERRAERFFAFKTDRVWHATYNDQRFPWGAPNISEPLLRLIFRTPENKNLVLTRRGKKDSILTPDDIVNLDAPGLERIFTQKRSWKLLVQGVLLSFDSPLVVVREALVKAGIDPDSGWTAALKFVGLPREAVKLTDTIDLSRKGIEKLWLRPDHINNGEAPTGLHRAFRLRDEDETYLQGRGEQWETVIDGAQRWFFIRNYALPDGYSQKKTDIAVLIPPTYPAAALDMFFCAPHLQLASGREIPQTQVKQGICGVSFQRWSRHRHGATTWNPSADNLITHIAIIDEAIAREVGA